jgi:hypothetical protein
MLKTSEDLSAAEREQVLNGYDQVLRHTVQRA